MKVLGKIYSNFWFRNIVVIVLLVCVFTFAASADKRERTLSQIWIELLPDFFIIYGAIIVSNLTMIKRYVITKQYDKFFPLAFCYWTGVIIGKGYVNMRTHDFDSWLIETVNVLFFAFLGTGAYFIHLWTFNDITVREKRLVSTVAELDFLKMQLNPHFLLNAMNNLYGEALTNPNETPERILQLSHLLRYQLEATKKEFVDVKDEIEFLNEYFNYYKFRSNNLIVDIDYKGVVGKFKIPPLMYFSLVENAIKFSLQTDNPYVKLRCYERNNRLFFEIENSCLSDELVQNGTGVGIKNLERRLEVTKLPYKFIRNKTKNYYKTKLELWELPINA
ncbi:sensor histidine kinase [Myroides pelagicus]|uniref:Histidine kinase n=1 Tax=Myroides pelagicus TaxID=270914 RepID=A0A7K1GM44_9FLAO|nr:histidine kinase [Myroides pelagicus]MEC4113974.1 histidine kinase [Myroides pelagicus]MTH29609.1 histidine kinase [Myroides pelagicus]